MNKFNLIYEKWIPVCGSGLVSLNDIFNEYKLYKELDGDPIQKIAILKFLMAIVQAASTPVDTNEWTAQKLENISENVLIYLHKQYDKFWLYGDEPFLQMPELVYFIDEKQLSSKSKSGFLPQGVTENTTIYLQSQIEPPASDADNALYLICLSGFARGGKQPTNKITLSGNFNKKHHLLQVNF